MTKPKPKVLIATSGWSYEHWKKNFYPVGLKNPEWLSFYSQTFSTVEINTTFYHTPLESTVKKWYETVPENFCFAIKSSRYITHQKRLNDCAKSLQFFYKSIKGFKEKAGPILFQLPPSFKINKERLLEFIALLDRNYLYTFEFRHETWYVEEIYEILRNNNIALCITDLYGKPSPEVLTANFTYLRLHGPHKTYVGSYGTTRLKKFKKKFMEWMNSGTSIYCYFDNDEKGFAIEDAKKLKDMF